MEVTLCFYVAKDNLATFDEDVSFLYTVVLEDQLGSLRIDLQPFQSVFDHAFHQLPFLVRWVLFAFPKFVEFFLQFPLRLVQVIFVLEHALLEPPVHYVDWPFLDAKTIYRWKQAVDLVAVFYVYSELWDVYAFGNYDVHI